MSETHIEFPQTCLDLLTCLSNVLFSAGLALPEITQELCTEALKQTVYSFLPLEKDARRYSVLSQNMRVHYEHLELHELMVQDNIPYVILKGSASARYYPEPLVRTAGDVDFLINETDFERAKKRLVSVGFCGVEDKGGIHVAFHRAPNSTWELHRHINGGNDLVDSYLSDVIGSAVEFGGMMVPSDFHHCLILLCHMASHITEAGIGLRHLCDWAVFVNRVDVSQWDQELKNCGLWRFAQIMSQLSALYIHLPVQPWFGEPDKELLFALMKDILVGGNFGTKDRDRYRQIRYIRNPNNGSLSNIGLFQQVLQIILNKAARENESPFKVLVEYFGLLLSGKRKLDTKRTVSEGMRRREIYSELMLYDNQM